MSDYDYAREREEVIDIFTQLLMKATGDGSKKRQAGSKPKWTVDPSHEAAIFSHLNKWKHGERVDPDSLTHPLVHLAWRALAIAWQESNGYFPNGAPTFHSPMSTGKIPVPQESPSPSSCRCGARTPCK